MQVPHLSFYITATGSLAMSYVYADTVDDPMVVDTPLDTLDGKGLDSTVKYLGRVVLGTMARMFPEEMAKHPELHPPADLRLDVDMIQHLISKSVSAKTCVFLAAIDALVEEVTIKDPGRRTDPAIATWPEARAMIEKNSRDG